MAKDYDGEFEMYWLDSEGDVVERPLDHHTTMVMVYRTGSLVRSFVGELNCSTVDVYDYDCSKGIDYTSDEWSSSEINSVRTKPIQTHEDLRLVCIDQYLMTGSYE